MKWIGNIYLFIALLGCASSPRDELARRQSAGRPNPAAFGTEGFFSDQSGPESSGGKKDFYFKNCEVVSRKTFPSHTEYECQNP